MHKVTIHHTMSYGHSGHMTATNECVDNVSDIGSDLALCIMMEMMALEALVL